MTDTDECMWRCLRGAVLMNRGCRRVGVLSRLLDARGCPQDAGRDGEVSSRDWDSGFRINESLRLPVSRKPLATDLYELPHLQKFCSLGNILAGAARGPRSRKVQGALERKTCTPGFKTREINRNFRICFCDFSWCCGLPRLAARHRWVGGSPTLSKDW